MEFNIDICFIYVLPLDLKPTEIDCSILFSFYFNEQINKKRKLVIYSK